MSMLFDIGQLSLCIIDDADEVCTTDIVKKYLMEKLRCRKVLMSATTLRAIIATDYSFIPINIQLPLNAQQFYIRFNDIIEKLQAVVKIYKALPPNAKAIVFCNVSVYVK